MGKTINKKFEDARDEFAQACLDEYYNTNWYKKEKYQRKCLQRILTKDGRTFYLECSFYPVPKEEEKFYNYFVKE